MVAGMYDTEVRLPLRKVVDDVLPYPRKMVGRYALFDLGVADDHMYFAFVQGSSTILELYHKNSECFTIPRNRIDFEGAPFDGVLLASSRDDVDGIDHRKNVIS